MAYLRRAAACCRSRKGSDTCVCLRFECVPWRSGGGAEGTGASGLLDRPAPGMPTDPPCQSPKAAALSEVCVIVCPGGGGAPPPHNRGRFRNPRNCGSSPAAAITARASAGHSPPATTTTSRTRQSAVHMKSLRGWSV